MSDAARSLVTVFAHPDDEAFSSGGTLSKYAALGCSVHVVTATRGESGGIADADLATPANLPRVREEELRCACLAYGIEPPSFLDYVDGQMTIVNQGRAVGKLVHLFREMRPQVVITFGGDGVYGHYDHIAVHRWTTIAVELAADPACFPDQVTGACRPHQVSKLYHVALPQRRVEEMAKVGRRAVMMDGVPFTFVGWRDHEITTVIDISAHAEQKRQGILCHRTQVGRENEYTAAPDQTMAENWFSRECFILARSIVGYPEQTETDLFERVARWR